MRVRSRNTSPLVASRLSIIPSTGMYSSECILSYNGLDVRAIGYERVRILRSALRDLMRRYISGEGY